MKAADLIVKAMIFAAGRGTRLAEFGQQTPKALIDLNGVKAIELIIEKLRSIQVKEIVINVYHLKEQIIEFVNSRNYQDLKISFSIEEDLLETGGGLKQALDLIGECDVLLMHNADVYSEIDLGRIVSAFNPQKQDVLLALQKRDSSRVLLCDQTLSVMGWENYKTNTKKLRSQAKAELQTLAFTGIQCVNQKFLGRLALETEKIFSTMKTYFAEGNQDLKICGIDVSSSAWFDLGTLEKIEAAKKYRGN